MTFQLPFWDTKPRYPPGSTFMVSLSTPFLGYDAEGERHSFRDHAFNSLFGIHLRSQEPSRNEENLSTPFLGYAGCSALRWPGRALLSTPFLGYRRYKIPCARGRYRHFQLPFWDTLQGAPAALRSSAFNSLFGIRILVASSPLSSPSLFQLPFWDTEDWAVLVVQIILIFQLPFWDTRRG